jgi:phosphomannomutase
VKGGNDYEIFSHPDVVGYTVVSPEDTMRQVRERFMQ